MTHSPQDPKTDLGRLRELAEKATPGPWTADPQRPGILRINDDPTCGILVGQRTNTSFIAAANPQTVLSLLDRIEVLKEQVENLIPIADVYCQAHEAVEEAHKVLKESR